MKQPIQPSWTLGAAITKAASKQTYYTIRFLMDRKLVHDAYLAYGYFRWVDDVADTNNAIEPVPGEVETSSKMAFIKRQETLLEACCQGQIPRNLFNEEVMLADLVWNGTGKNPGLQSYLRNMMTVMKFDITRLGRVISQLELSEYSRMLATAVTDAMFYFIGHNDLAPAHIGHYLAVTAAHFAHMLRNTRRDVHDLKLNIPGEYLQAHRISQWDIESPVYQGWVCSRVKLARRCFKAGREYLAQVRYLRCRLAGYAHTARFEWMLRTLKRDNYCLRSDYRER
jgi:Squalene/phytoene synthase